MEEIEREQPIEEPTNTLNKVSDDSVVSEIGSQTTDLGKFKNVEALLDAYNNLQSEFTKKCQLLSKFEKDKTNVDDKIKSSQNNNEETKQSEINGSEKKESFDDGLHKFLIENSDAETFVDEIRNNFNQNNIQSPYQRAWANVVLSHLQNKEGKENDPIINQYVLSDENVKNKIIESYLNELQLKQAPITISSKGGERLSGILPDNPTTLEEAKQITSKMFS